MDINPKLYKPGAVRTQFYLEKFWYSTFYGGFSMFKRAKKSK